MNTARMVGPLGLMGFIGFLTVLGPARPGRCPDHLGLSPAICTLMIELLMKLLSVSAGSDLGMKPEATGFQRLPRQAACRT